MEKERDYRLDVLKAISIVFVLLWHIQPVNFTLTAPSDNFSFILKFLIAGFNFQLSLIAVPTFYIVSLFLFFKKSKHDITHSNKRIKRTTKVYLFWFLIQTLIYLLLKYFIPAFQPGVTTGNQSILNIFITGGPSLPEVGGSVFYFLFNMIALIILSRLYLFIGNLRLSIILIILINFYFLFCSAIQVKIPYWRIDNFIIYIPAAYFLLHCSNSIKLTRYSYMLYFVFTIYDILAKLLLDHYPNTYGRNSIFFGALSIFLTVTTFKMLRKSSIVVFLSTYSLGIFAIHKYWMLFFIYVFTELLSLLCLGKSIYIFDSEISSINLFISLPTLICTILTISVLKHNSYIRQFIS